MSLLKYQAIDCSIDNKRLLLLNLMIIDDLLFIKNLLNLLKVNLNEIFNLMFIEI